MKRMDKKFFKIKKSLEQFEEKNINKDDYLSPIETDNDSKLNFVVFGDPQISAFSPFRAANFASSCRDISRMSEPLDAIILAGDVAEFGKSEEYRLTADILNSISKKFDYFFAVPGNHDVRFRRFGSQLSVFNNFVKSVNNGVCSDNNKYWFSREIKGYKFIFMGTDKSTFEAAYISPEQLEWLDKELEANDKIGKPCFVFNHQTLKKHNGLPITWLGKGKWRGSVGNQSDKIKNIFEKHSNIIFITGHLHYCTNKYTYDDRGSYKCLSVPTVGVYNHGDYAEHTQSYLVSVFEDRIVMRSRIFGRGKYAESDICNSQIVIELT